MGGGERGVGVRVATRVRSSHKLHSSVLELDS